MELPLIVLAAAIVVAAIILARRPAGFSNAFAAGSDDEVHRIAAQVASLAGAFEESRRFEEQSAHALAGIERMFAGSHSRGRMGENLLAAALGAFPADMLVRDLRIGGRVCEFGLRMADGKMLPIDSKWPGMPFPASLEAPGEVVDEATRARVDRAVCDRLVEVARYIDPAVTTPLAVVALPDPIYSCCRKAFTHASDLRLVVVSYSGAMPAVLSILSLHRAYSRDAAGERSLQNIHELAVVLSQMASHLHGKVSRSLATITNAMGELRAMVSRAQSLASSAGGHSADLEIANDLDEELELSAGAI